MWLALSIGVSGWLLSLGLAGYVGYRWERIVARIASIEIELQKKAVKKEAEPVKSSLIDPQDLRQRLQWEQDEKMRALNK